MYSLSRELVSCCWKFRGTQCRLHDVQLQKFGLVSLKFQNHRRDVYVLGDRGCEQSLAHHVVLPLMKFSLIAFAAAGASCHVRRCLRESLISEFR